MKVKKVSIIFGTRPEAIKLAPVIREFEASSDFACHVCTTGQHREMLQQVLEVFCIRPDTDLKLMQPGQTLAEFSSRTLTAVDAYLARQDPDVVIVQGDTTTALCATLAAFYRRIPVGHVEAGLRTWNLDSPWPEEANRVLITRLAALHFAPTELNREHLLKEGVPDDRVLITGNTVIDALFLALEHVVKSPPHILNLPDCLQPTSSIKHSGTRSPQLVLITGHRRENFGKGLENICSAIAQLANDFPETHFVYPVHLNPNVREPVSRILGSKNGLRKNIHLTEPLSYLPFVALMNRSAIILTDSGGVQEEGPTLGKPVLVMRDTTERPEALGSGNVRLVGTSKARIVSEVTRLLRDSPARAAMSKRSSLFGDGKAAHRIVSAVAKFLETSRRLQGHQRRDR
jgi:UDP-N-acetylglucosamine 2-epimerase (non-hydrolysing)